MHNFQKREKLSVPIGLCSDVKTNNVVQEKTLKITVLYQIKMSYGVSSLWNLSNVMRFLLSCYEIFINYYALG